MSLSKIEILLPSSLSEFGETIYFDTAEAVYDNLIARKSSERKNALVKLTNPFHVNLLGFRLEYPQLWREKSKRWRIVSNWKEGYFPTPFAFIDRIALSEFLHFFPTELRLCRSIYFSEFASPMETRIEYLRKGKEWVNLSSYFYPDCERREGDLFVRAPMGFGKTTAVANGLADSLSSRFGKEKSVLIISPRRTITATIFRKMKNVKITGLTNYLECDILDREHVWRIVISPNSMPKMKVLLHYDYVIVDEIMLLLTYIFSDHPRNKKKMIRCLDFVFRTCQRLILCDAYLSPLVADIFRRYRSDRGDRLLTHRFLDFRRMKIGESDGIGMKYIARSGREGGEFFRKELAKQVATGGRMYIFCETVKRAKGVYGQVQLMLGNKNKAKAMLITGQTKDKIGILSDPNKTFVKYNIIVASPVILSGFDFVEDHFPVIYGLYRGNVLSAMSIAQMSGRIRKAKICNLIDETKRLKSERKGNRGSLSYFSDDKIIDRVDNLIGVDVEFVENLGKFQVKEGLIGELHIFIRQFLELTKGRLEEFVDISSGKK